MAAAKTAAEALGLAEHLGTVAEGRLADLLVVDGDPLAEPGVLSDASRIWLVLQLGVPAAGQALETTAFAAQPARPLPTHAHPTAFKNAHPDHLTSSDATAVGSLGTYSAAAFTGSGQP